MQKIQKRQKQLHPFLGGLKNKQEVVPLFPPKRRISKSSKTPIFIVFPEKVGGGHFFQKRPMLKGGDF